MISVRTHFVIASRHSVGQHRFGHFHESTNVCAVHVVHESLLACAVFDTSSMNTEHDSLEPLIDLFAGPREPHAVLRLLQSRYRDTPGVRRLRWPEQYLVREKVVDRIRVARHVRALSDSPNSVLDQLLGVGECQLVLGRAGKSGGAGDGPWPFAGMKRRFLEFRSVLGDPAAPNFL